MAVIPSIDISWNGNWRPKGPMGLRNLGNTCYLNSVLQCLTYTPPLANLCIQSQHSRQCMSESAVLCPFCLLERWIAVSLKGDAAVESPGRLYRCLLTYAKIFREGRQEDAHELLRYAIDACDNVCIRLLKAKKPSKEAKKAESRTAMKQIFGGVLRSQIRCLSCKAESNKLDGMMDLSLEIMNMKSVKDAMAKFFQPEVLDGSNKYQCEKCKKLSVARKQMSIYQAPNVLVIQLKRFENFFGGKIDRHVEFEEKLILGPYMSESSKDVRPEYQLYAVVVHSGSTQYGGHYFAYVKDPRGKWYCCNDSSVTVVSSFDVLSEKVYMLFYLRCHAKPAVIKVARSASSTPSPPTTPDPVVVGKSHTALVDAGPTNLTRNGQRTKFQVVKPAAAKSALLNYSTSQEASVQPIDKMETSSGMPESAEVNHNADPKQAGSSSQKTLSISRKRPREMLSSFQSRLKQVVESKDLEDFQTRLVEEYSVALKQSSWCKELKESLRDAKRFKPCSDLVADVREPLLARVPASIKGQLVKQVQQFFADQNI